MFMRLSGASKDERLEARRLYLPKDDLTLAWEHENGSAIYTYRNTKTDAPCAIAFWGSSAKPHFCYRYRDEAKRQEAVEQFKGDVLSHVARVSERRAAKAAWVNPLKVGDVLYTSWGYDQTNVDFYAVTYVSGKRVKVREICSESAGRDRVRAVRPVIFTSSGVETTHVAQPAGERGASVTIDQSRTAWLDSQDATHYETGMYGGH